MTSYCLHERVHTKPQTQKPPRVLLSRGCYAYVTTKSKLYFMKEAFMHISGSKYRFRYAWLSFMEIKRSIWYTCSSEGPNFGLGVRVGQNGFGQRSRRKVIHD